MLSGVRAAREVERGQTLPIWTFAVLTALVLMFFLLNYAHILREQVRAQNAADSMATMMLSEQATQWNKMTTVLYAADVEEWRIRNILQGMINAAGNNGGCQQAGMCQQVYAKLQPQYFNAVNRYTSDLYALDNFSWVPQPDIQSQALQVILFNYPCSAVPVKSSDCGFKYKQLNYSQRAPAQQVGKDALYVHVGGNYGTSYFANTTPNPAWEPARVEVESCETVQPLVSFSFLGVHPQAVDVVGRAAATVVPVTTEWLVPGITTNPATSSVFQPTEDYSGFGSPWYQTTFPAQPYTSNGSDYTFTTAAPDMEAFVSWWGVIPIAPYSGTTPTPSAGCAGFY